MARLNAAEKKKKAAAERKKASRERLALGGSYRAQVDVDARIAQVLVGAAEVLGCTIGQVIDDLAGTYPLLVVPNWIIPDYHEHSVGLDIIVDVSTREVLGSREPFLLPCDVVEWLVLSACRLDIGTGRLTYHHPHMIGFEAEPPVDGIPFEMPAATPPGAVAVATKLIHVPGGLHSYDGTTGNWDGPTRDRYADRMAYRQAMREAHTGVSRFRRVEEDYGTLAADARIDNPYEVGGWQQTGRQVLGATLSPLRAKHAPTCTQPHGYYQSDSWDEEDIRRKLATIKEQAIAPAREEKKRDFWREWGEAQDWSDRTAGAL